MKNLKYLFFSVLLFFIVFSNSQENRFFVLSQKDSFYTVPHNKIYSLKNLSRKFHLQELLNKSINDNRRFTKNPNLNLWKEFFVQPKGSGKYIALYFKNIEIGNLHIPYKNGKYIQNPLGFINPETSRYNLQTKNLVVIPFDSIDFSKAFLYNYKMISFKGLKSEVTPQILITNNKNMIKGYFPVDKDFIQSGFYTAIFLFSFLMFFIAFLITKNKNYLFYSLYLICITLIFAIKIPYISSFALKFHPKAVYVLDLLFQVLGTVFYFYFAIHFLRLKQKNQKLYGFARLFVVASLAYALLIPVFSISDSHILINHKIFLLYTLIFAVIGTFYSVYLLMNKSTLTDKVIIFGAFLLLISHLNTILTHNYTVFLNIAVFEIILFFMVISYLNKQTLMKNIKNEIALEFEKTKKENLIEINKIKSSFIANISHEFRTPLTIITGISTQLKNVLSNEEDRKKIDIINRNSNRLLSLINQLLDISKIDAGYFVLKISNHNFTHFVNPIIESFDYLAKQKEINFKWIIKCPQKNIWFDRDALEKILSNLLSNSVKYTHPKGEIKLHIGCNTKYLEILIQDTGEKLTPEELNKIFERFYQKDINAEGVGLGLALIKELVHLHKGTITAKSERKWTTFQVKIPIDKESYSENEIYCIKEKENKFLDVENNEVENCNENSQTETKHTKNKPLVLIVDDNQEILNYVTDILKDRYNIIKAKNGEEGIRKAVKKIPDLIISDVMMPQIDGFELCKSLKNNFITSHIPIILLTAKAGVKNKIEGTKCGADDYITKPFNEELLQIKVENLLNERQKLKERYSRVQRKDIIELADNNTDEQFLRQIDQVLNKYLLDSSFTASDFAKILNVSRMQLHRKLKATTGLSTTEFIRSQRLKKATEIIKRSNITISEVCYEVGFNNPAYFSKCFKEVFGCSPTEYASKFKN